MKEGPNPGVTHVSPKPEPPQLPVIRIRVPARMAYDLDSMTKITANMVKELGCEPCHSGYDIRFEMISRYTINKKLDVVPVPDVLT